MDSTGPRQTRPSFLLLLASLVGALGLGACIAVLYSGMRAIMATGTGFVAVGGPYEIANPAPEWVWVVPTSVVTGLLFGALLCLSAWMIDRINVVMVVWSVLFLVLGWNFLQFGLDPSVGEGIVWGWLVSGVAFVLMALAPLLLPIQRARAMKKYGSDVFAPVPHRLEPVTRRFVVAGIGVAMGVGFVLGASLFGMLSA